MLLTAEITKLRATRSTWILVGLAIATCALWTVVTAAMDAGSLTVGEQVRNVYQNAQQGYLFALIVGALGMTTEYRHQTITWSFLTSPVRHRFLLAKLAGYAAVAGPVLAVACALSTVVTALIVLPGYDLPTTVPGLTGVLLGSMAATVLYTTLGLALGALVRNQIAALVVVWVWFYNAEFLLVWYLPEVGKWTPTGAAKSLSGWSVESATLLPAWAGGLMLLAYTALLTLAAFATTLRRDVT